MVVTQRGEPGNASTTIGRPGPVKARAIFFVYSRSLLQILYESVAGLQNSLCIPPLLLAVISNVVGHVVIISPRFFGLGSDWFVRR